MYSNENSQYCESLALVHAWFGDANVFQTINKDQYIGYFNNKEFFQNIHIFAWSDKTL